MCLVSALACPALAARVSNPFPIVLACAACHFGGFAGRWLAPMAAPLLWVPLVRLGPSTFPLGLTLINLRTRTPAGSASLSGFMQGVGSAVASLGPLLFGVRRASTGGWTWPVARPGGREGVLVGGGGEVGWARARGD